MKKQATFAFLIFILGIGSWLMADVQVLDPGYQAELFTSYQSGGFTSHMIFDSPGNMYVVNRDQGSISKIDSNGNVTVNWSSGYGYSVDIVETTGTSYGSDFIVSDYNNGKLYKVDSSGNKTEFVSLSNPLAMAMDTKGTYGSSLFALSSYRDQIYSISTSGQTSLFCNQFYNISGNPLGLNFDPGSRYGGGMYLGIYSETHGGIYSVDTNGNAVKFSTDVKSSGALEFDHPAGLFGGDMFALARDDTVQGIYELYRFDTDGSSTLFMNHSNPALGVGGFNFGPDGALYAAVKDTGTGFVDIYRVTPVPEPTTFILLGTGAFLLRKRWT